MKRRRTKPESPWFAKINDRCLLCRRKSLPGLLVCKRHEDAKVELKEYRLPVILTPEAFVVSFPKPMPLTQCADCGVFATLAKLRYSHLAVYSAISDPTSRGGDVFRCVDEYECQRRQGLGFLPRIKFLVPKEPTFIDCFRDVKESIERESLYPKAIARELDRRWRRILPRRKRPK